ncbi:helix-turn-helix domain-containing protein [Wenxinia saemankumensis]|uniref:helix-turn-helix domain-containing protein n=1 Tax=Wenxinia saemankumensis TaxID=1447782 RepID=UPI0009F83C87|nr:cupin domain-containing protein [Wenxinia saemankumensis]
MVKNPVASAHLELGSALRNRRKQLKMSMQTVADKAGLSVGFISQVERGLTSPSLSSLVGIAEVLKAPISDFLDQPEAVGTTRGNHRETYFVDPAGPNYERISSKFPGMQLYSVIVHEPPGFRAEPISHRGEEMFFILAGEVTVEIEGTVEILLTGDSIHFDSTRVHSTWNHTTEPTSILWIGTMDIFGDAPSPIHNGTPINGGHTHLPTGDTRE